MRASNRRPIDPKHTCVNLIYYVYFWIIYRYVCIQIQPVSTPWELAITWLLHCVLAASVGCNFVQASSPSSSLSSSSSLWWSRCRLLLLLLLLIMIISTSPTSTRPGWTNTVHMIEVKRVFFLGLSEAWAFKRPPPSNPLSQRRQRT